MRLHRFYISIPLGEEVILENKSIINQIINVFRAKTGYEFILFNSKDNIDYKYKIENVTKNTLDLSLVEKIERDKLNSNNTNLCLSLIKKDNFEKVVESAVQIGVKNLIPIISDRTEKKDINLERLEKIIIESTEQSGRNDLMTLESPKKITEILDRAGCHIVFEKNSRKNKFELNKDEKIYAYVGPEGGWSVEEIETFSKKQAKSIPFNTYTLRAETAGVLAANYIINL